MDKDELHNVRVERSHKHMAPISNSRRAVRQPLVSSSLYSTTATPTTLVTKYLIGRTKARPFLPPPIQYILLPPILFPSHTETSVFQVSIRK